MCHHPNCKTRTTYNVEGQKALYCGQHKREGMVDVKNKTCCEEGCKKHPIYNVEGETKRLYCNEHKKEGMVNVISKSCKSEWCTICI